VYILSIFYLCIDHSPAAKEDVITTLESVRDAVNILKDQQTESADLLHDIDKMLRALCIQTEVPLSNLRLRNHTTSHLSAVDPTRLGC
jgi:orotate phosphoribosyltransferase